MPFPLSSPNSPNYKGWRTLVVLVAWGITLLLLFRLLRGGTAPLRIFYLLALAIGVFRPWWALSAIALLGPLSLLDPGKTHRLLQTDAFVLGAILGHLRAWRISGAPLFLQPGTDRGGKKTLWSFWSVAVWIGVAAAAVPGVLLLLIVPDFRPPGPPVWDTFSSALVGSATLAPWVLRSFFNWTTALLLAWVAAREATSERVKSLFLLASTSMVVSCLVGLGNYMGIYSLTAWRAPNLELAGFGFKRLMGLAGHSGWFAEWIVLTWPGLLFLFGRGRTRRRLGVLALGIVMVALLLSMARAAWLSVAVAGFLAVWFLFRRPEFRFRGYGWLLAGVAFLAVVVAFLLGGMELFRRLRHIFQIQDRWNYYISTYHILGVFPFGAGLGLHFITYESLFTSFHRFWQFDHVTAHSTWLQILVEQGPFQLLLIVGGVSGVVVCGWRAFRRAEGESRQVLLVLSLAFIGILVDSLAQYLGYIRVVEGMTWIVGGSLVGLCGKGVLPKSVAENGERRPAASTSLFPRLSEVGLRRAGRLLMLTALVVGILAAGVHWHEVKNDPLPRALEYDPATKGYHLWTERHWRFPVDPSWCGIEFLVLGKSIPQDVEIDAPGTQPLRLHFAPGERRAVRLAWKPKKRSGPFTSLPWLSLRCSATWIPAEVEPGSTDRRSLGVYIENLHPLYCDDDPRRPPKQWWRQSDGGSVSVIDEGRKNR